MQDAGQYFDSGRLPGAIRADESYRLPRRNRQAYLVDGDNLLMNAPEAPSSFQSKSLTELFYFDAISHSCSEQNFIRFSQLWTGAIIYHRVGQLSGE
jgi:hypothetical protein